MKPIPMAHRKIINSDQYFKKSCLTGKKATLGDRIVIHHAWLYGSSQISEMWNYCPLLDSEHSPYSKQSSVHNSKDMENKVKLIAIERAGLDYLKKNFPKKNWEQIHKYLSEKYGLQHNTA